MGLIKCPECSHQVSDKAIACPFCGCPIKEQSDKDIFQMTEKERLKELAKIKRDRRYKNIEAKPVSGITIFCSYLLAVLMPFFGFFAGIYLIAKKQAGHGVVVMAISSAIMLFIWSLTPIFLLNLLK